MGIIEKLRQFLSPNDKPPVTSNAPSPEIVAIASSQPTPVDLIAIDEQRIRKDFWEAMRAIVRTHGKALQIKRAQLVSTDAYGNSIEDKFEVERDYFITNVMYRGVPAHLLEFLLGPSSLDFGRMLFSQGSTLARIYQVWSMSNTACKNSGRRYGMQDQQRQVAIKEST